MTQPGINVAWMASSIPEGADDARMLWYDLASTPEWDAWLSTHTEPLELFSVVYFEVRDNTRMTVRGDDLSYYIAVDQLEEAARAENLRGFMQDVFFAVYRRWAEKRDLPPPPTGTTVPAD